MKGVVAGGRLNVAVISAGDYFFPRLLACFMRRHPGITLNLTVHNREELLRRLAENMTDLAVMVRPPQGPEIVREAFAPHHSVGIQLGQFTVLDVAGFPAGRHWFIVHRSAKRLPPVAEAFRQFLLAEGEQWLARTMHSDRRSKRGGVPASHAAVQG